MAEIGKQRLPWHLREMTGGEQPELFAIKTSGARYSSTLNRATDGPRGRRFCFSR